VVGLKVPQREAKFRVNAPPAEVWRFIRDFEALCTCIPGVEDIRVLDGRSAELTVREKIGVVPMIVKLTARIESEDPPRRLHAVAHAEHLTMTIDVELRADGSGTELVSQFDVKGEGPLKPIVDRLFEKRATERTAQFAECIGKRFSASAPAPAIEEERDGSVWRWLARLWRRLTSSS
jgi:carbon monoxide dehydrogenase subunit G